MKNIIVGWWNWLFKPKEEWMIERKKICNQCPRKRLGMCGECGCVINAKVTVSSASCPLGKWSSLETNEDVLNRILNELN